MQDPKSSRRPVVDPLVLALKSRRVMVALCALLVGLLTLALPELEAVRGEILTLVITMALGVIGGYSVEDAAAAARDRSAAPPADLRELIKDVLNRTVDEISDQLHDQPDES